MSKSTGGSSHQITIRAKDMEGKVKQAPNFVASKTLYDTQHNSSTKTRSVTPTAKSGPIPLALPQLISSRGRAVSISSQFEDSFETAPQSEAALSRLSSRVHSPRTGPRSYGAQDIGNESTKSPFFRWKAFMLDKTSPAYKTVVASPPQSSLEANAGSDGTEQAHDSTFDQQLRANDLMQAADGSASSQLENDQTTTSRRSIEESHQPQILGPKGLTLWKVVSTGQDELSRNDAAYATMIKQADVAERRHNTAQTEHTMQLW